MQPSSKMILVVDDDAQIRRSLKDVLSLHGWRSLAVATGKAGLRIAQKMRPQVIILDIQLPDMSGFEVCSLLRKALPECAILLMSGRFVGNEDKVEGLALGADDYLTKPVNPPELVARIQ